MGSLKNGKLKSSMANFCTECGTQNEVTNYCASCGFAVQKADAPSISTDETENSDDWGDAEEGVYELAENILDQCQQLLDNANVERIDFFRIDGRHAFSVQSDLGVIDTAFDSGLPLDIADWEPLDDDDETITDVKHIYLEPDYFFDLDGDGCGGELFQAISIALDCEGPDDLHVKAKLKKPAGKKFVYLMHEAD
jgi:hypothetical protein